MDFFANSSLYCLHKTSFSKILFSFKNHEYLCASMWWHGHMYAVACRGQMMRLNILQLKLKVVVVVGYPPGKIAQT